MKRTILTFVALAFCTIVCNAQVLEVFSCDNDGKFTNVRNAPKGTVVDKISTDAMAMFGVKTPQNGWWRISGDEYETPDSGDIKLKGSRSGYWIHYSTIGVNTRNYGGQTLSLRSAPGGKAIYSFKEEITLRPIDIKGGWVKVVTFDGKHTGWIEEVWLCGNSVTNCS